MSPVSSSQASFSSVVALWHHRARATPDADAMYGRDRDGDWYTLTWAQAARRERKMACGLMARGIQREQRCAILSSTRPEWVLIDIAVMAAGAATTTLYPSSTADECGYILGDSQSRVCFAENQDQVDKLRAQRESLPHLELVVVLEGSSSDDGWVLSLERLEREGQDWDRKHPGAYQERADAVGPDDLATLIYTSGTTGRPKGVRLAHDCWVFEAEAIDRMGMMTPSDTHYLFLPLAHSFAKVLACGFIRTGTPTVVDGDMDQLALNLSLTQPTVMGGVPRVFEKLYNRAVVNAKSGGLVRHGVFRWALKVGREVSQGLQAGQEPRPTLELKRKVADRLVFSKLRARLGGRIRYFISGGAPLSWEIAEFFHAAGILVLEGYGLTESSAASFCNRPHAYRFGTVGQAAPGVQARIAPDGEVLLAGRGIMRGYHGLPEESAQALTPEGWLYTGDIGQLDAEGFLRITGRKKDIIVTAGGKNIAPQVIEGRFRQLCPLISQVVVHGDKRNFCVALMTLNEEAAGAWAHEEGLSWSGYAQLATLPEVLERVSADVRALNRDLPHHEHLRAFALLDHELTVESGELTPKMSVKRRVVERNNSALLDSFYEGAIETL